MTQASKHARPFKTRKFLRNIFLPKSATEARCRKHVATRAPEIIHIPYRIGKSRSKISWHALPLISVSSQTQSSHEVPTCGNCHIFAWAMAHQPNAPALSWRGFLFKNVLPSASSWSKTCGWEWPNGPLVQYLTGFKIGSPSLSFISKSLASSIGRPVSTAIALALGFALDLAFVFPAAFTAGRLAMDAAGLFIAAKIKWSPDSDNGRRK